MRLTLPIVIIILTTILSSCSSQTTEFKENKKEVEEVKVVEEEINQEEISLEGEWVFLSDDNLGRLRIEQIEKDKIKYYLGGTVITSNSAYANSFEGTGIIKDGEIEFFNESYAKCGGIMEINNNIITVTVADNSCHTPAVYLNGDFKKADSIKDSPIFSVENENFTIRGVSIGASPSIVKGMLGNPSYEGPDEEGYYEWVQDYKEKNIFISYSSNQVDTINIQASFRDFDVAIATEFKGDKYVTEEGIIYLFNPENEQLLIYQIINEDSSTVGTLVTRADGNFYYGVENGWIKKL